MRADSETAFAAVRFGNVLGSNGSVIPLFLEQIKAGGPVTVTHPQMRRFFMLIPEAVQLVLHGATLGEDGALYVLDMGEQIPLLEIARSLIRLSGHIPDQDIPIAFTRPRPGEKLYEELVGPDEVCKPSGVEKILRVKSRQPVATSALKQRIAELERAAFANDSAGVLERLGLLAGGINRLQESFNEGDQALLPLGESVAGGPAEHPIAMEFSLQKRLHQ